MLAVNYSTIRNNLKDYCDKATDDGETVCGALDQIAVFLSDCIENRKDNRGKEYCLFRVCGTVDTYEQN